MIRLTSFRLLSALLLVLVAGLCFAATPYPSLTTLPLGERWFSISLNDDRAGFVRQTIGKTSEGYRISADSSVKMTVLGFSREAAVREQYEVRPDLSLVSFAVEQTLDGSPLKVSGKAVAEGVSVTVETAGSVRHKLLKGKGPVYPGAVLNLYPLVQGFSTGKKYRVKVFDPEEVKIKEVVVTAVGREKLPGSGDTFHLRNDLYPVVDNDIWVDLQGNTLKESVRDGLIVTLAEDAVTASRLLAENVLARKDMVLDFSLVPATPQITAPATLKRLVVTLDGWPDDLPVPEGWGQKIVSRTAEGVTLQLTHPHLPVVPVPLDDAEQRRYLDATERIIPDHPQLVELAASIAGDAKDPATTVARLVQWVATNIEGAVTDSISPVETLKSRKGNCQSHARLYVSLARASGVPTRFISGLIYQQGKGFLYHSWAESFVAGRWLPVDPTFGQIPADLTHVRMFDGDAPGDVAPLARIVGRLRAKVIEQGYEIESGRSGDE